MSGTPASAGARGAAESFTGRVFGAWRDPRASLRSILDTEPSEGRILSFMMIAGAILYAVLSLELTVEAASDPTRDRDALSALYGFGLLVYLGVMPLVLMLLAALIGVVSRACGGVGTWRESRAAVAWSWVISAPIFAVLALPPLLFPLPIDLDRGLEAIGLSFFVVGLSYNVAEAHRFSRVWVVFLALGGLTVTAWGIVLYLTA